MVPKRPYACLAAVPHSGRKVLPMRTATGPRALIVNADDWGCDRRTTNAIFDCFQCGAISSVSAMLFMQDSEHAAEIAREHGIDAGLHLNLTTPFSAALTPPRLADHQQRISRHLSRNRFAPAVFHPGLIRSFEYVVAAQLDEYARLYGIPAGRIDGHHHMHLSANVVFSTLLPAGSVMRRNFSFRAGERPFCNRLYRKFVDGMIGRRYRLTDLFYSLTPLEPAQRLREIFLQARLRVVEVECHPARPEERAFLAGGRFFCCLEEAQIAGPAKHHLV